MKIRLASELQTDSIVDGLGIRTVIWTQGCPHNCLGCHNPSTHSFDDGAWIEVEEIKEELKNLSGQDGITFSGGDPMCQPEACYEIAKYAHKIGYNVWCYTGYTFEELLKLSKFKPAIMTFLKEVDILIDGKFVLSEKSYNLKFKGSRNQRIINVKESLKQGQVCLNAIDLELPQKDSKVKAEGVYI